MIRSRFLVCLFFVAWTLKFCTFYNNNNNNFYFTGARLFKNADPLANSISCTDTLLSVTWSFGGATGIGIAYNCTLSNGESKVKG